LIEGEKCCTEIIHLKLKPPSYPVLKVVLGSFRIVSTGMVA